MQCLYCGKALNLLRELADSEFCSRDHQQRYKRLTARAFSRLLETQPAPAPRLPPEHLSFCRLPPPEPASTNSRRRGEVGPWVASTVELAVPEFAPGTPRFAPILAGAAQASGPAPARWAAVEFAESDPLEFHRGIARDALRDPRLLIVDESLGALARVLSQRPKLAPIALCSQAQGAGGTHAPVTEVLARPSTPEVCLPTSLTAVDVGSHLGLAGFSLSAPTAMDMSPEAAGAPAPLLPSTRLGMPVRAAGNVLAPGPAGLLPLGMPEAVSTGSMLMTASEALPSLHAPPLRRPEFLATPDCVSLRVRDAVAEEVPGADVMEIAVSETVAPCPVFKSAQPALASLSISTPDPAGLLPLGMPEAVLAGGMMTASEPISCPPVPLVRRPKLTAAPNSLALRVKGAVAEEVFGADVVDRPAGMPVTPSLASGSVLPALASLFRYGRLARPAAPMPHMSEGLNPRNRLAQPAAYMELPMPVQHPAVPRTSGLRIVETFEYLKPMEAPPFDLLQSLVQVWMKAPVYLRYAAVPACLILLFWAYIPRGGIAQMVASRWGRIEAGIGERAAVELAEDFQGGMETWEGAGDWPKTWQISKAGYVRPGKLALYQPSMRMREYQVEFLMQVEKKALGWAYRATDQENYYASKITIVKPGPLPVLSLVRYPVIGGREGARVEIPIRVLMHNNTPYRVQLTVSSGGFSTAIEGQLVDFWRDESLKVGGFGFFSDTGESARVYWMRLNHQDDFIGRVCAYFNPAPVNRRRRYRPQ